MLHPQYTIHNYTLALNVYKNTLIARRTGRVQWCNKCTMYDTVMHHAHSSCRRMTTARMTFTYVSHMCLHTQKDASHSTYTPNWFQAIVHAHTHDNLTVRTHNVHATAPRSRSYNYIFKVLFTAPSWYVFSIGFGHMSIFWWDLAPIRIPVQRNITRTVYTVNSCAQVADGAVTLSCSMLQIVYTRTRNGNTCVYNNSMQTSLVPTVI